MFINKVTLSSEYPKYTEVFDHLSLFTQSSFKAPCFYDIETTGLGYANSIVYLIGTVTHADEGWVLTQWFAETIEDEILIISKFCDQLNSCDCTIQYNGDQFDQPYLEHKLAMYQLPSPFEHKPSVDLYKKFKPLKALLKLSNLKQATLEEHLHSNQKSFKRIFPDGKECISLYKKYLTKNSYASISDTLGHNKEDLLGLGALFLYARYFSFYNSDYTVRSCRYCDKSVVFELELQNEIPVPFSNGNADFYLTAERNRAAVSIPIKDGKIKNYFSNYKDYLYLPAEDCVIPKILGSTIPKDAKKNARPETCYTWFQCNPDFLTDENLYSAYIKKNLKLLLSFIK